MPKNVLILLLAMPCVACGPTDRPSAAPPIAGGPTAMTQQEAETFLNTLAAEVRSADSSMYASYYHQHATFISAQRRIDSRDSIAKFWREAVATGAGRTLEFHPVRFGSSGNLAWFLAHFTGGVTSRTGFMMTVMQREPDGAVKIISQMAVAQ